MKKKDRIAGLMLFAGFVLCGFLGTQNGAVPAAGAASKATESIQLKQLQIQSGVFTTVRLAHGGAVPHQNGVVLTLPKAQFEQLKHELQATSERSGSQW